MRSVKQGRCNLVPTPLKIPYCFSSFISVVLMSSLASSKIAATRDGVAFKQILDVHDAAEKQNNLFN